MSEIIELSEEEKKKYELEENPVATIYVLEVDKKAPIRLHRPEQQVLRPGIKIAVEEQGQCHRAIEAEVHLLVEGQEVDLHPEAGKEVAEPIALRLRRDGWRGSVAPLQAAARG